ncbi:MAG: transcriptional repressor LexA [Desulfotalea sp.]
MELTNKQQELLTYLEGKIENGDGVPTLREIAGDLDVSYSNIAHRFKELERKGYVKREGKYSRSIQLYPQEFESIHEVVKKLPIIGQVTAGLPMYAQQEWEGEVVVDPKLFPGDNLFCLRIKGQSMRDAGIFDGDLVVCEPRQYAQNGEIIVALVHGEEATVKYFQLNQDHVTLVPANSDFKSVDYPFSDLLVQGKVKGVIRDRVFE